MSYLRADQVLPRELLEAIQQYVDGQLIYIPSKERHSWGSGTSTRLYLRERNEEIYGAFKNGAAIDELSRKYSLSEKSIQRILREQSKNHLSED